jgi:hypothetical protein
MKGERVIGKLIAMFEFEKLEVYQVVKSQNLKVLTFISKSTSIDIFLKDQWKRASLGIMLNLAEGTGRMSVEDKKHFYTIARGSIYSTGKYSAWQKFKMDLSIRLQD